MTGVSVEVAEERQSRLGRLGERTRRGQEEKAKTEDKRSWSLICIISPVEGHLVTNGNRGPADLTESVWQLRPGPTIFSQPSRCQSPLLQQRCEMYCRG